jgi:MFS family permease
MNKQPDQIEAALRTPEPPLADDDFSERVLARLPPRRRRSTAQRWTLAGAAALGSALTLALAPPLETVLGSLLPSLSSWSIPPSALSAVAIVAVVMVPALLVFFAERSDR